MGLAEPLRSRCLMLLGGGKGEPRGRSWRHSAGPQPRAVGSKDPEPGSSFVFVNTVWSWESKDKALEAWS